MTVVRCRSGSASYYAAGVVVSAIEAHRVDAGTSFASAVAALEPWQSLVLVPAAVAVLVGFAAFSRAAWRMTERQRAEGRAALAATPARLLGNDPQTRPPPQPGRARGLRAAARPDGVSRRRLALRRLPADRLDPADGRPCDHLGDHPGRVQPVRRRAAARDRLGSRARLAADDGAGLVCAALPRAGASPREAQRQTAPRTHAQSRRLPDTRQRRDRRDRAAADRDPVRPCARRGGWEHRALLVRAAADARGDGPVRGDEARPREALRLAASRRRPSRTTRFAFTPPDLDALLVRAAAVDSPKAYQLFDLDRGVPVPLLVRGASPRQLVLSPGDRCGRGATRSSPRTRACSEGATSPTSGSCPPLRP